MIAKNENNGRGGRDAYLPLPLGQVRITSGAIRAMHAADDAGHQLIAPALLYRHRLGDWGEVGAEDWAINDNSLATRGRIHSVYRLPGGARVWVVTDAGWQTTTIYLPSEH